MKNKKLIYSMHALKRSSQRSIKHSVLDLIFNEADKKVRKREGVEAIYISKRKIEQLITSNTYKKDLIEKSKNIFLLVQNNILITVVRSKNAFYRRKPKFNIAA